MEVLVLTKSEGLNVSVNLALLEISVRETSMNVSSTNRVIQEVQEHVFSWTILINVNVTQDGLERIVVLLSIIVKPIHA